MGCKGRFPMAKFLAYTFAAWTPIPKHGDCPTTVPVRGISWGYPGSDFWQQQGAYCNGHFVTFALSFPMGVVPPLWSKLTSISENLDVLKDKLWLMLNSCEKQSLFVEGDSEILGCENRMSRELLWRSECKVNKILGYYVTRNICSYSLRLAFLHWNRRHLWLGWEKQKLHTKYGGELCNPLEDEVSYKVTLWKMSEKKENLKMEGNYRLS